MSTNCLIFDCDGVLVDSESIYVDRELAFLGAHGIDLDRDRYVRKFMGTSGNDWESEIHKLFAARDKIPPSPESFRKHADETVETLKANLTAVHGAADCLQEISVPMCVASSSSPDELNWKLRAAGLRQFFEDYVFSASEVRNGKPAPDLFLHAASNMRVQPSDSIVIEDSRNGIVAAKRAGMTAIGITAGKHCSTAHSEMLLEGGADHVVRTFDELVDWLVISA